MKQSELNHLRLLLGWVRCEIGQEPEALVSMVQDFARKGLDMNNDFAQKAMVEAHDKARSAPKYVRAAVKALSKLAQPGAIVDAEERWNKLQMDKTIYKCNDCDWIGQTDGMCPRCAAEIHTATDEERAPHANHRT